MGLRRASTIFLIVFIGCTLTAAQDRSGETFPDSAGRWDDDTGNTLIEDLAGDVESEDQDLQLLDRLTWLQDHPYDLNTVGRNELESIPGITPEEAGAVLRYRNLVRLFSSVGQLIALGEEGEVIFSKLRRFVIVRAEKGAPAGPDKRLIEITSRVQRDLRPGRGYRDGSFTGSSAALQSRMLLHAGDQAHAGLLVDKDAGEAWSYGFRSGYAEWVNASPDFHLVLGDYTVEAAQGLVLWRSSALGMESGMVTAVRKSSAGLQPHRSANESGFFRGGALAASLPEGFRLTALYSSRAIAATVPDGDTITGAYTSGLFRTASEQGKFNAVRERTFGLRLEWERGDLFSLGGTVCDVVLSKPYGGADPFSFSGDRCSVAGIDAMIRGGEVSLFGEAAVSRGGGHAAVGGALIEVGLRTKVALLLRDYGADFYNFHALGFGSGTDTRNEKGFSIGAETRPVSRLNIYLGMDFFRHPMPTHGSPFPSDGAEMILQADADVTGRVSISSRLSVRTSETTETGHDGLGREVRLQCERAQERWRTSLIVEPSRSLRLRGRVEVTRVRYLSGGGSELGYLLYEDVRYAYPSGLSIEGRLVFFHTGSFDSRVYEYENDLRGVFSNPSLFGKGRRWYLLIRYPIAGVMTFSMKYSQTQKDGVKTMGSGDAEIMGDTDDRIGAQLEVAL